MELTWRVVELRRDLRVLEGFSCTAELPRSTRGRSLPHPRPWEHTVQSHLRSLSLQLRPGHLVLLGSLDDGLVAVAHLVIDEEADATSVFVVAIAVANHVRREGGAVADATMAQIWEVASERAVATAASEIFVTGKIDISNRAAQRLATRFGQEPVGLPVRRLQLWVRHGRRDHPSRLPTGWSS